MAVDLGGVSASTTSATNISVGAGTSTSFSTPATTPGSTLSSLPTTSSGSGDPAAVVSAATAAAVGGVTLQYNTTTPKYYMKLSIGTYSRSGTTLSSISTEFNQGSIILPLPENLTDAHGVRYTETELGSLTGYIAGHLPAVAGGVSEAYKAIPSAKDALDPNAWSKFGNVLKNKVDAIGAGGIGTGATALGLQAASTFGGPVVQGLQAITGYSPNQFLTILLGGPTYKRHQFVWRFSPRNNQESQNLNNILNLLHNSAAPSMSSDGLLFKFPKIFQILIYPNSKYLMKFKPSVLEAITIDFNGAGFPNFFRPGADGLNAPTTVILNLQFHELEFWLSGNYSGSNDPTDVEQQSDAFANPISSAIASGINNSINAGTNLLGIGSSAPGASPSSSGGP